MTELVPQPGGFEGFVLVEVVLHPADRSETHGSEAIHLDIGLDAARLPATARLAGSEHAVAEGLDLSRCRDSYVLPRVSDALIQRRASSGPASVPTSLKRGSVWTSTSRAWEATT
jgi:hypothetical protein